MTMHPDVAAAVLVFDLHPAPAGLANFRRVTFPVVASVLPAKAPGFFAMSASGVIDAVTASPRRVRGVA